MTTSRVSLKRGRRPSGAPPPPSVTTTSSAAEGEGMPTPKRVRRVAPPLVCEEATIRDDVTPPPLSAFAPPSAARRDTHATSSGLSSVWGPTEAEGETPLPEHNGEEEPSFRPAAAADEVKERRLLEQGEGLSGTALQHFLQNQFMEGLDDVDQLLSQLNF